MNRRRLCFLSVSIMLISTSALTSSPYVFLIEGPSIDVYTQKGGEGFNQPSAPFAPGEQIQIYANVTYEGVGVEGKLVAFEVFNAENTSVLARVAETNQNGIASMYFRIPQNGLPEQVIGIWTIFATVSIGEQTVSDMLNFEVSGIMIDLYTQRGGRGPDLPSDAFAPQEEVIFYASVTYDFDPVEAKIVAFQIFDANNSLIDYRTAETNATGIALINMRIPSTPIFGTWCAIATVEVLNLVVNDTLTFKVGWIIEILSLQIVNEKSEAKLEFLRGERINFLLYVQNIAFVPKIVTFTITVYDACKVPIGHVLLPHWIVSPNRSIIFILGIDIPIWSYSGLSAVYANACTNLPNVNGQPYCPETKVEFQIG